MSLIRRTPQPTSNFPTLLEEFFNEPFFMFAPGGQQAQGALALDVSETESSVLVRASLPGFTKDQIGVEVHDGVLTIRADKTEEHEEQTERFHRRERRVGSVSRSVTLPAAVADDKAKAELKDGVLTLTFPKSPNARPKKISIS